jgi:hypothetical protein
MFLFANQSKIPYLLITFASNINFLIPKSKSSTTTTNIIYVTIKINIVQNKETKTYQNEFENK